MKEANDALTNWIVHLPAGTDFTRHWSGKPNFQEAVRALRADTAYSTLYRFASSMAHASDVAAHFEVDDATGNLCHNLKPRVRGFEAPSYAARELLWNSAAAINKRFGLTFSALLAPHTVTKKG